MCTYLLEEEKVSQRYLQLVHHKLFEVVWNPSQRQCQFSVETQKASCVFFARYPPTKKKKYGWGG